MAQRTFIVDRSKWRCGGDGKFSKGKGPTNLRNEKGMMCCLGHTLHQCGVPMEKILHKSMPSGVGSVGFLGRASMFIRQVGSKSGRFQKHASIDNTELSSIAAEINDMEGLPIKRRERILRKWFNQKGFGLSFVGKSVPNPDASNEIDDEELVKMTDDEIITYFVERN